MAKYLDDIKFTALFRSNHRNRNRRRIAEGLHLIAMNSMRRIKFRVPPEELEDAAAEAVHHAVQRIHKFDPRRPSAFCYFTTLIYRSMCRYLKNAAKRRVMPFSQVVVFKHEFENEEVMGITRGGVIDGKHYKLLQGA